MLKAKILCLWQHNRTVAFIYFAPVMPLIRILFAALLLGVSFSTATAQDIYWSSPESEQMYQTAKDALMRGLIKQAVALLQQLADREPGAPIVQRDLGQALLLDGRGQDAALTVTPMIEAGVADEQTYQIAGAAWLQAGEKKKAKKILEAGVKRYPQSGLIYHELGRYYETIGDLEYALDAWLQGIQGSPDYYLNYYEAARTYLGTSKPVWTILYGEVFINKERQTPRSYEMRKMVLEAYRQVFTVKSHFDSTDVKFDAAVTYTLQQLAPVVADGMTVENLTMLRTRFVIDWMTNYSSKYPFSLFTFQDRLLQEGYFDAYNQWMFGKADNAAQFEAWSKFHPEALPAMEKWVNTNRYQATASDFYNDKELRALLVKKKK
jgi:tetratricopeptide (TPR) repeat protein